MSDPHEPGPRHSARGFIVPVLIGLAVIALVVLHLTEVVGPAH